MKTCTRRGGILQGLLIFLAVAAFAVCALLYFGVQVARNVQIETSSADNSGAVKIKTPAGSIRVDGHRNVNASTYGVPVYPNSRLVSEGGKSASIKIDFGGSETRLAVVGAVYWTGDSVDQVRSFYRDKLPNWTVSDHGFEFHEGGYKRMIAISRVGDETKIALASIGEPAAN